MLTAAIHLQHVAGRSTSADSPYPGRPGSSSSQHNIAATTGISACKVLTFLPSGSFLSAASLLGPACVTVTDCCCMPVFMTRSSLTSILPTDRSSVLLTVGAAWLGLQLASLNSLKVVAQGPVKEPVQDKQTHQQVS